MNHEFKPTILDQITWPAIRQELIKKEFWFALFWAILWALFGIGLVFVSGHVLRWKTQIHELIWFIVLPIPMALIISQFAGWWHKSRRILWTTRLLGGSLCLAWLPLALMAIIMAIGFAGIR